MTAPAGVPICECGDPQTQHKELKGGCRRCEIGCARYVEDKDATAKAQAEFAGVDVADARQLVEAHAEKERRAAESHAARLRRVEEERDAAVHEAAKARAQAAGLGAELASARTELEELAKLRQRTDALVTEAQRLREQNRKLDNDREVLDARLAQAHAEVRRLYAEVNPEPIAEFTITITRKGATPA